MKIYAKAILFIFLLFPVLSSLTYSQLAEKTYTGTVVDENGEAITGALVIGDEGDVRALSDPDGNFSITVTLSDLLYIEAEGYDPQLISGTILGDQSTVTMVRRPYLMGLHETVKIPFGEAEQRRITGSVHKIDVEAMQQYDNGLTLGQAINGLVPGVFGTQDLWGLGDAWVVVDGIPREAESVNLSEVKSISVMKDPVSRAMYGTHSSRGLILVETKRGEANKKKLRIQGRYGIQTPKQMPEFLSAADYMRAFNQASINDGDSARYSAEAISATESGSNPAFYPDNDFYSDTYLKSMTQFYHFNADASGGNEAAQYYVNLGWKHDQGWGNLGEADKGDVLNLRGNVDYSITDWLDMDLDVVAKFDWWKGPNVVDVNNNGYITSDFWDKLSTSLPNAYPAYWDAGMIADETVRNGILNTAQLIDGNHILGGNNVYTRNLYGDMSQRGQRESLDRHLQFNTGLNMDLSFITEGLKASGFITFDFRNLFVAQQNTAYAVYEPLMLTSSTGADSIAVNKIGVDNPTNEKTVQGGEIFFHRRMGLFGNISYDKVIGDHNISALAVAYRDQFFIPYDPETTNHASYQQHTKALHWGLRFNYMFQEKYIAELAATVLGSQKLDPESRLGFAPALGLGWVLSEEDFLSGSSSINYLKLRANFGVLKNDYFSQYSLYETLYATGGWYNYENSVSRNREMNYATIASDIGWQTRTEFSVGFDASLLNNSLWIEAGYFNSTSSDLVTNMTSKYPQLIGGANIYENYNANNDQGVELGIKYNKNMGDLQLTLGANMVYASPKVKQIDEVNYEYDYLSREGKASDAIWGWEDDGLYGESDFDASGNLVSGIPIPTFGVVQPGDIKYVDQNTDGFIDEDDQVDIGNYQSRLQYALSIRLKYKMISFYALGVGQNGGNNLMNSAYYWVYGNRKYSTVVNDAYGPGNTDVNASFPRLSSTENSNNFRTSTFWMYDDNWFKIPTIQLTYHIKSDPTAALKDMRVFLRAVNAISIGKNLDKSELNITSAPQTRAFAIGFESSF